MTTVDEAFRSVTQAWPALVEIADILRKHVPAKDHERTIGRLVALTRHWPSAHQIAKAYHHVATDEFSSQSYADSVKQVERWYIAAMNSLNAHYDIEHCDGKSRHHLRVTNVDDLNRRRECIVCCIVVEVAEYVGNSWAWRKP